MAVPQQGGLLSSHLSADCRVRAWRNAPPLARIMKSVIDESHVTLLNTPSGVERMQWSRIVLGAVLMELLMFAFVAPLDISGGAAFYAVPFLTVAIAFVVALWVARPLGSRFALHGVLAAAVASLIDIGVVQMAGESVPWLYWASHGLRLLGATAGGLVVERGART